MARLKDLTKPPALPPGKSWNYLGPLSMLQQPVQAQPNDPHAKPMPTPVEPIYRPTPGIRCPLPPTGIVNPDNLRQLHQPGVQVSRILPQPAAASNNGLAIKRVF
jgi:hypothetical protein